MTVRDVALHSNPVRRARVTVTDPGTAVVTTATRAVWAI